MWENWRSRKIKQLSHLRNGRYFVIPIVFLILMMTRTIFTQAVMEIYAYKYMVQCKVEKSSRKDILQLKSRQNQTIENKTNENKTKENKEKNGNAKDKTQNTPVNQSLVFSFIKPVRGGITSSCFGDSIDRNSVHKGHDWAVPTGTRVKASEKGTVELAYYSESYGYNVLIRHSDTIETRYAHMSKLYVKQGDKVKKGETLGLSGSTGDSTGPHLHFEVIQNGIKINPLSVLN